MECVLKCIYAIYTPYAHVISCRSSGIDIHAQIVIMLARRSAYACVLVNVSIFQKPENKQKRALADRTAYVCVCMCACMCVCGGKNEIRSETRENDMKKCILDL